MTFTSFFEFVISDWRSLFKHFTPECSDLWICTPPPPPTLLHTHIHLHFHNYANRFLFNFCIIWLRIKTRRERKSKQKRCLLLSGGEDTSVQAPRPFYPFTTSGLLWGFSVFAQLRTCSFTAVFYLMLVWGEDETKQPGPVRTAWPFMDDETHHLCFPNV